MGINTLKILDNGFKKDKMETVDFYIYRDRIVYELLEKNFFNSEETKESRFESETTGETLVFKDYNAKWIQDEGVEIFLDNANYENMIKKMKELNAKEILIARR
jgi:hypothetical protein